MEKIIEIYGEVKRKAKIEKVRPDNISRFKEFLKIHWQKIEKNYPRKITTFIYLKRYLFDFFFEPVWQQKLLLYALFKSKEPKSLRAIGRELGLDDQRFLSVKILQDMGLIELKKGFVDGVSIKKVNHQLFKEYWPQIEEWGKEKKSKRGEQTERFFLILAERIKEKGLTPKVIEAIREINRGDFKERGWDIKNRVLTKLKRKVLKMPTEEFIRNLEMAERKLGFLFTKFSFLVK